MTEFTKPLTVAVLISGGGRTLRNLIERSREGRLPVEVRLVISSSSQAGGLEHARQADIPALVVRKSQYDTPAAYREAIFQPCREAGVQAVVMAGFLKHVLIPADFENRVVNIHPALIPSFCGKGLYGERVHQAVLESGVKLSGCTVHFVDNQYDHGPIILQRAVEVRDDDTPHTLADRVFAQELEALPEALTLLAENRLTVQGRKVVRT